jgi:hypothetical protein
MNSYYLNGASGIDIQKVLESQWTINIVTGLIVTIVGGIIVYFIYRHFDRKQKDLEKKFTNQNEVNEAKDEAIAAVAVSPKKNYQPVPISSTGYELVQKINKVAPYLREEAEQAYVDQPINLEVKFRDLDKVTGSADRVRLYLVSKEGYPWVYGTVSLKKYPWLKTLPEDTLIDVEGVITKFHSQEIQLKNMTLTKK